ncbi:MAG: hypothetical protein O7B99_10835 [Planctomycetota bacterium]|nr:hypothetical protein [Planctomycetota bacterium]
MKGLGLRDLRGGDERRKPVGLALVLRAGEREARRVEDPVERVVVGRRDRVELVVVAARAGQRGPQDRAAERVDHVADDQVAVLLLADAEAPREREEAGGDGPLGEALGGLLSGQYVAGDLLAQECVVGHVAVERVDHPVAVAPGVLDRIVRAVAGGVGVARQVEPVAPPALPVARRAEQALDHALPGHRRPVPEERVDLVGSGGQPGQVVGDAAQERVPIRRAEG